MLQLLTILTILSFPYKGESPPYYHEVSVRSGEGVISLLQRYDLTPNTCNLDQFYHLNSINSDDQLLKDRDYKIPILIYHYNSKSIRSSIEDSDWDKAVRIQHYNEGILKKGLRKTTYRESKILWVPYDEIYCIDKPIEEKTIIKSEAKKVVENQVIFSLFGVGNEKVYIENRSLKGQVFYLVAGHGGPDPGAIAYNVNNKYDLCEDEYAYDVSLRLARALLKKGATVHMIIEDKNDGIRSDAFLSCDYDETCGGKAIPSNQLKRLNQRANRVNTLFRNYKARGVKSQKVICIHVDSRAQHKRQDVFFYYYGKSRSSKKLAQNLHSTFNQKYKKYQANRGYHGTLSARPLYMLRKTDAPSVYVELANIRNEKDRKRLLQEGNREALANWLAEGLAK